MLECIFTIDYEIYGNGQGELRDLVYEPAKRLTEIFQAHGFRYVNFVEVAEFERIDEKGTDPAIDLVKRQIRDLHREGFEIALHLHPQWYNASFEQGRWCLDLSEYNLCTLPRTRISEIVRRGLAYLRLMVDSSSFTPLSYRAGNWLFQPTQNAARVLGENGIRLDSSVFKGGLQRQHRLDYRPSQKNADYWRFGSDVNQPDPSGPWIEVPIHSEMVPLWKLRTSKRMTFKNQFGASNQSRLGKVSRLGDFLRFRYPLKFDFCRMTLTELTAMMDRLIDRDRLQPHAVRPVVAIGHTKDLFDYETVDRFLSYLAAKRIRVSTFSDIYPRLFNHA